MQKKILFSIMAMLMLLLVIGCGPFNTEAKISYASHTTTGTTLEEKMIKITVTLGNSVYIDSIEEVNAKVNEATKKLKFIKTKLNDENKVINIYALQGADSTTANAITVKDTNKVVIESIKCKDENGNTVTVSGLELIGVITIKSTGGDTTNTDTDLTAVSGLVAKEKSTSSGYEVTVSWTESSNAGTGGYKVYKMTSNNGIFKEDEETEIVTTGEAITTSRTSYTDTNVTAGNTYFYRVTAYNGTKETDKQIKPTYVEIKATITTEVKIPAVTKVVAEADTDAILLTWEATIVSGANIIGYNIYGCETINGLYQKLENTTNTPTNVDSIKLSIKKGVKFGTIILSSGTPIYLKVKAVAEDETEGTFSSAVKATMYDSTVPMLQSATQIKLVPYGNTSGTETKLGAKLQWVNLNGVTEYIIERTESTSGTYSEIVRLDKNDAEYDANSVDDNYTAFIDGSFMELKNKKAFYRIRCIKNGAVGRPSGTVMVEDEAEPDAPAITTKTNYLGFYTVDNKTNLTKNETIYEFYYDDTTKAVSLNDATTTNTKDFAGYKIYMSNKYDGEYQYVGSVGELWGAQITVPHSLIKPTIALTDVLDLDGDSNTTEILRDTLDLDGDGNVTECFADTSNNPIYVRVSIYDYFGNETALSIRSVNLNKGIENLIQ